MHGPSGQSPAYQHPHQHGTAARPSDDPLGTLDPSEIALPVGGPGPVIPGKRGSIVLKRKTNVQSSSVAAALDFERNKIKKSRFIPKITKANILDTYCFKKELGRGGFSSVFACFHKELQEERAVKVIKKNSLHPSINYEIEMAILMELDHPNIIKIYEVFENEAYIYIVQE